ncbi:MAG TPA: hypothetical protein VK506_05770 [Conexibacter sp.]|nr:hypothetical protein [Conexibacter sp.]
MAKDRADVRNAADPEQVERAGRKEKRLATREQDLTRAVLATPEGRAFCWSLLVKAKVFESIYHASALIHYNAGRQDFGHELIALLLDADEDGYLLMEKEARAFNRREANSTDAVHTKPVSPEA